jgi:hypothetical protein
MPRYRELDLNAPDYEPLEFWSSDADQDPAEWLASLGGSGNGDGTYSFGGTEEDAS